MADYPPSKVTPVVHPEYRWQLLWITPDGLTIRISFNSTIQDMERNLAEDIEFFKKYPLMYTISIPLEFYIQIEKIRSEEGKE